MIRGSGGRHAVNDAAVLRGHRIDAFDNIGAALVLLSALLYGALIAFATGVARDAAAAAREPHVALILPLASHTFSRHADAVRQGFVAAARAAAKNAPPVRIYSVNEDSVNVLTIYEQA